MACRDDGLMRVTKRIAHDFAGQELLGTKQLVRLRPPAVPFVRSKRAWAAYMTVGMLVDDVRYVLPCIRVGVRKARMTSVQAIAAWMKAITTNG